MRIEEQGKKRPLVTDAMAAVRELHSATEALLDAAAARYGINRNDMRCLEILEREGPLGGRQLAASSHLSPAAVTKVVDRLEARGYVTRRRDEHDRRAHIIETSAKHGDVREAIWTPAVAETTAELNPLPEPELRRLAAVLRLLAGVSRRQASRIDQQGGRASEVGGNGEQQGPAAHR